MTSMRHIPAGTPAQAADAKPGDQPQPAGQAAVAASTAAPRRGLAGWVKEHSRVDAGPLAVLVGIALIWIFFQAQNGNFLSSRNLSNLVLQLAVTCILAIGVVLVLIAGAMGPLSF